MAIHQIKLEGPGVHGLVVKAAVLRDLLGLVIDGSQGAVRLRTQGRSVARGSPPAWIPKAAEFSVRILEGSTVLEITALALREVRPPQGDLFPEIDGDLTGFDYFAESVLSAVEGQAHSKVFDKSLLSLMTHFDTLFRQGVEAVSLIASPNRSERNVRLQPEHIELFEALQRRIPPAEQARVAGKLDSIRHSDKTFDLLLPTGQRIKGLADNIPGELLQASWGKTVVVGGTAFFTASAEIQRLEADSMGVASEAEVDLWAFVPAPLEAEITVPSLRVAQGPRSGINAIVGAWPGDESDDDLAAALEELS